jgi:hypothetical protein
MQSSAAMTSAWASIGGTGRGARDAGAGGTSARGAHETAAVAKRTERIDVALNKGNFLHKPVVGCEFRATSPVRLVQRSVLL